MMIVNHLDDAFHLINPQDIIFLGDNFLYKFEITRAERDQLRNNSNLPFLSRAAFSTASPKIPTLPPTPYERCDGSLQPSVALSGAALEAEGALASERGGDQGYLNHMEGLGGGGETCTPSMSPKAQCPWKPTLSPLPLGGGQRMAAGSWTPSRHPME